MKADKSLRTAVTITSFLDNPCSPMSSSECPTRRSPESSRDGKRILLVDDDVTVRDSLNAVLASEGFEVVPAENGQRALDLALQSAFDLVLLDLNMPVKNGWDTFEQLTREHPLLPVIIVTARPNQLFTALGAGVGALLEKPMDIPMLLRTIAKLLAESAEQRLGRLAGKKTEFHYQASATATHSPGDPGGKP
jgi:DNA-binding response OmpR family regulator